MRYVCVVPVFGDMWVQLVAPADWVVSGDASQDVPPFDECQTSKPVSCAELSSHDTTMLPDESFAAVQLDGALGVV